MLPLLDTIVRWLRFAFDGGPEPPQTPSVAMSVAARWMIFRVKAAPGGAPNLAARLYVASRLDSTPDPACDFTTVRLLGLGSEFYGVVPIGQPMPCGPPLTPDNALYFASVTDLLGAVASSKMQYRSAELAFLPLAYREESQIDCCSR